MTRQSTPSEATSSGAPLLMTPGPTRVPRQVLEASHTLVHHRTDRFSEALGETLELLRPFIGSAAADILPLHATGRAGMEGAITNFFAPGDPVIVCCNGKFGEMWASFADSYGLDVRRVAEDWDRSVDPAEVGAAVEECGDVRGVLCVHSDTSTGVLNPIAEVAEVARAGGALMLVDGISSIAGCPFHFDAWRLDFAVVSSQKCLMSSPGLSFAVVGPRAWTSVERSTFPRNYLDFNAIRSALAGPRPETPGTTPVGLVLQVLQALRMLTAEGIDGVFARHRDMAQAVRRHATAMGFGLQGDHIAQRSPTLTALTVPQDVDPHQLRASVREADVEIAVGLGSYAKTCIRIGHMGDIRMADVDRTMGLIRAALP